MCQRFADFAQGRQLTTSSKSRIDSQDTAAPEGRLHEQAFQIAGKDPDRMFLSLVGQLAANFALEARQQQTVKGVAQRFGQQLRMRMIAEIGDFRGHAAHWARARTPPES